MGSHRGTADYAAQRVAPSSASRNADADLLGSLRDPVPSPYAWEWCACVCQGARVSFTDLLPLQGSSHFGATSKFLPHFPLPSALEGEKGPQSSRTVTAVPLPALRWIRPRGSGRATEVQVMGRECGATVRGTRGGALSHRRSGNGRSGGQQRLRGDRGEGIPLADPLEESWKGEGLAGGEPAGIWWGPTFGRR